MVWGYLGEGLRHSLKSHGLGEIVIGGGGQRAVDQHSVEFHWYFLLQFQGCPQTGLNVVGSFKVLRRSVPPHRQLSSLVLPLLPLLFPFKKGGAHTHPISACLRYPPGHVLGGT